MWKKINLMETSIETEKCFKQLLEKYGQLFNIILKFT